MSKKRVLYIGTPIFNYYKNIIAEFEAQGYSVDYYNDRPSENSFVKGIIKIRKSFVNSLIKKYFEQILSETKDKSYDLIFIINGKIFTPDMIRRLRESQKSARFVLYMWDSLIHYPECRELIPLFDKSYSFDNDDCQQIKGLSFLPLFYCKNYESLGQTDVTEKQHDIISVCTAHPNRYKIMRELFPKLESKGIRIFSYMFLNKLQYLYNRALVPEFKNAKSSEFRFNPLSEEQTLDYLRKSSTVFDIHPTKQSGLTMRTIETFGAKRKLITTNTNIKKYDFYNENNIYILDESNEKKIQEFISRKYQPINDEVYRKYSLHSWLKTIVNEADNKYLK